MKKTQQDKKLSIDVVVVRPLAPELTPEQLQVVIGGRLNESSRSRAAC